MQATQPVTVAMVPATRASGRITRAENHRAGNAIVQPGRSGSAHVR